MRAWQVPELGEPRDVLTLAEVPDPVPGPGQVLVRVLGAAANFPDVLMCRGGYQVRPPLPFTPGVELCGEVVGTGQRVIGNPALPQGALAEYALTLLVVVAVFRTRGDNVLLPQPFAQLQLGPPPCAILLLIE